MDKNQPGPILTEAMIQNLCGSLSFGKGRTLYKNGKVLLADMAEDGSRVEALVQDKLQSHVSVRAASGGRLEASCSSCPPLGSYVKGCKHVAAVLVAVKERLLGGGEEPGRRRSAGKKPSAGDKAPPSGVDKLLQLFATAQAPAAPGLAERLVDSRRLTRAELVCAPVLLDGGLRLLGIALSVADGRGLRPVRRIRDFLLRIGAGAAADPVETGAAFDPQQQRFPAGQEALLRLLAETAGTEALYRQPAEQAGAAASALPESVLPVPPAVWPRLQPLLLQAAGLKLEHRGAAYDGLREGDGAPELGFRLEEAAGGEYELRADGLAGVTAFPAYAAALQGNALHRLDPQQAMRLDELQRLLADAPEGKLSIPEGQLEALAAGVLPELAKLGSVKLDARLEERMIRHPLKARLYLDRVRDKLLAALEFQYGEIVFNPLEDLRQRGAGAILIRDPEREAEIFRVLEEHKPASTDAGYFLSGEEEEYQFLYRTVPKLEKLLQIYATNAVRIRMPSSTAPPQVRVEVDERTDWLEFRFSMDGVPAEEVRHLVEAVQERKPYYRLPSGAFVSLEGDRFAEMIRIIQDTGMASRIGPDGSFKLPLLQGLPLLHHASGEDAGMRFGPALLKLAEDLRHPERLEFQLPESLDNVLRDYQKTGFRWFKTLAHYGLGGILADDMGLGKTLQAISFLVSVLPEIRESGRPALVVCPSSLLYNWSSELERFAPGMRAVIADGSRKERSAKLSRLDGVDVVIASYPLVRLDSADYDALAFHTLILDEAQMIKNDVTSTARAVKRLNARHRFALSGTPLENRLTELWSICEAVLPGLFGSRREFQELRSEEVARMIRPFLLRRLKRDVLSELPDKIETMLKTDLLPEQKRLYASYLVKLRAEALKHMAEGIFELKKIRILAGLTRLRQICNHPAVFVEDYAGGSAKFDQLMDLIRDCRLSGRRPLVFSQYTGMLEMIRRRLTEQGVSAFLLEGSTPARERVEICRRFNAGERDVCLLSLKAGGTGLNLTGADTVILYDLWWNPASEQQAMDRAHRIGQDKTVQVFRLVARGTIEERMHDMQQRKRRLAEEVIQGTAEADMPLLNQDDIRELLALPGATS